MSDDDNSGKNISAAIKGLASLIALIIVLAKGYEKLDIPNYPVEVSSPLILDYDSTPAAVNFSLITTKDGIKHFCFEVDTNSGLIYYDATNRYYINNADIETIEKYEESIREEVPTIRGYGDPRKLEEVATALMEEYSQKVLVRK